MPFQLVQESTGKICYKVAKTYACFAPHTIHPVVKETREELEPLVARINAMNKAYGTILIKEVGESRAADPKPVVKKTEPKSKIKFTNTCTNVNAIHDLCSKCSRCCKQRAAAILYECPLFHEEDL